MMESSFRKVEIQGHATCSLAEQPAPILDWLPLDRLVIDDRFQRPLNEGSWKAIRKIAENFRWSRFGPILVAPIAGGLYSVVDGQHRVHAAALCGIESVPAMAVQIGMAEQAMAFAQVNTALIRVSAHQSYRAALAAGDPVATAARDAVSAAGCELTAMRLGGLTLTRDQVIQMAGMSAVEDMENTASWEAMNTATRAVSVEAA